MTNDQIRELVNATGRRIVKSGLPKTKNGCFVLARVEGEWDITVTEKEAADNIDGMAIKFPIPKNLPDDEVGQAIDVAGYLTEKLKRYFAGVRGNQLRTAEQRRASAKKAIEARWARYRERQGTK